MKKLTSILLALVMMMSLSTVAFAAESQDLTNYLDKAPIVPKTYKINNGTAPAETFTFSFEGISYKDGDGNTTTVSDSFTIPEINQVTISYESSNAEEWEAYKTVEVTIDANAYDLGVYTYKVTETDNGTAGVDYSDEELYLVLSILRDEASAKHYVAAMHYETVEGSKSTGFTNEYNSGSLAVTKQITGNMADMSKTFEFTVVFTAPSGDTVKSAITTTDGMTIDSITYNEGGSAAGWTTATYVFKLGDDATMTFSNLPAGVTYTISEDKENYTSKNETYSDTEKTISAGDNDTYEITNELTNEIDTGIGLDSIPYIMILVIAVAGLFVFVNKKRMAED